MSEVRNDLLPPRDHNRPTLDAITGELLDAELLEDRREADLLLQRASTCLINTPEDAAGVQLIGVKIKALMKKLHDDRMALSLPYREAVIAINEAYGAQSTRLDAGVKTLEDMLRAFQRKQDEEAAAARLAAQEEARKRQEEAEAAQRRAREAQTAGASIEAAQAQEAAVLAARRAETIRPAPIPTALGSVATKREKRHEITDWTLLMRWLAKFHRDALRAAGAEILRRHLVAVPVARYLTTEIPGVRVWLDESAQIRSR